MRRVVAYFTWKSDWWRQRATTRNVENDDVTRRGLLAYAARQVSLFRSLKIRAEELRTVSSAKAVKELAESSPVITTVESTHPHHAPAHEAAALPLLERDDGTLSYEATALAAEDALYEARWDTLG